MKIVFYKTLLTEYSELTPTEKIVYSFLVSKYITFADFLFESDGKTLRTDDLCELLDESPYIDICNINNTKIAQELNISRKSAIRSMQKLQILGLVKDNSIFIAKELPLNGYFELQNTEVISGELLIFYSYLKNKAKNYNNTLDTYKEKLANELNTTKLAITKLLNRLYSLNLAKRLENGKLLIK